MSALEEHYDRIISAYGEMHYEPSELHGGKFAEVVVRVLQWHTAGTYVPLGGHIRNLQQELRAFENTPGTSDSVRFHLPNALRTIATLRNKRGVGHASGDVSPNHMDAELILANAKWVLAELVRIFHGVPTAEASRLVEAITAREVPLVWDVGPVKRVLRDVAKRDATLILLLAEHPRELSADTLVRWVEHSNPTVFRKKVLGGLHAERLVDFDPASRLVRLSPTGVVAAQRLASGLRSRGGTTRALVLARA